MPFHVLSVVFCELKLACLLSIHAVLLMERLNEVGYFVLNFAEARPTARQ